MFCPLFSAFGPEPIHQRLSIGEGNVLLTTEALYSRRKIAELRASLPHLKYVLVIGESRPTQLSATHDFHTLMKNASENFEIARTDPEDMALIHFTSGTTGKPKGAVHVHKALIAHYMTGNYALDLHPDDVFWCTADPGWVTGTSYGIISPLSHGIASIVDEADFDAERWYRIIQEQKVTVWYTAPTAVRMMMKAGTDIIQKYDLSSLRFISSVGEPLNPEAVVWGQEAFGLPIHDNWWQTETGGIMIANYQSMEIRPGSMGRPLPGIEAAIVQRHKDGSIEQLKAEQVGELALRPGWPSMFRAYLHEEERYRKCFAGGWYLTGDLAKQDADGYFWFIGRADDVIKSAGHLIGPFEVESALMEHRAVAEGRRHRYSRSDHRRSGQGLRLFEKGFRAQRSAAQRAARPRALASGSGRGAERNRFSRQFAEDTQQQDHAPSAQGQGAGAARGRFVEFGERLMAQHGMAAIGEERILSPRRHEGHEGFRRTKLRTLCSSW